MHSAEKTKQIIDQLKEDFRLKTGRDLSTGAAMSTLIECASNAQEQGRNWGSIELRSWETVSGHPEHLYVYDIEITPTSEDGESGGHYADFDFSLVLAEEAV